MKNNNKITGVFDGEKLKYVKIDQESPQTNMSKSISDRLDKMESMLLYSINKMDEIDKKLDVFMNTINIRTVGQVYKSNEEETWYDELKRTVKWKK